MDNSAHLDSLSSGNRMLDIFPYRDIRPVQAEMISVVKDAVDSHVHAVMEGPTGMGKTIALLCGVLKSREAKRRKLVYCSRTHKQMDRVIEELQALSSKMRISGISLRGRREMCINEMVLRSTTTVSEATYTCSMARKLGRCEFFENMMGQEEHIAELQQSLLERPVFASDLIEVCKREMFCPYEVVKTVLAEVKVIAASYIYLFDPAIRQTFLHNLGATPDDLIVVLDEAHNIPDMAIGLASSVLTSNSIRAAVREAEEFKEGELRDLINYFSERIETLANKYVGTEGEKLLHGEELLDEITKGLEKRKLDLGLGELLDLLERVGEDHLLKRLRQGKAPRSHINHLAGFLRAWKETVGRREYMHVLSREGTKDELVTKLEIQALDARVITKPVVENVYTTISMSGTLTPLYAYRDIVGLREDTVLAEYPSPFEKENVLSLVVQGVTTKEDYRTPEMYKKFVAKIAEVADTTPANVGVFTASHEVLKGLRDAGLEGALEKPLLFEGREMSSSENDELVEKFKAFAKKDGAVLLGVMGGRNSEGGDFPGDEMNAVVVVGIPYAPPSKRVEAAVEYLESQFQGKGRFYGYYLPAHRRMCQAAGRAHRLLTDKAAVVFMDWRVATNFVKKSLPFWLRERLETVRDEKGALAKRLQKFFD